MVVGTLSAGSLLRRRPFPDPPVVRRRHPGKPVLNELTQRLTESVSVLSGFFGDFIFAGLVPDPPVFADAIRGSPLLKDCTVDVVVELLKQFISSPRQTNESAL